MKKLLNLALALSFITIGYNIIEGIISLYFGMHDATLALAGFGTDSFVEVISGLGIAHMVLRMKKQQSTANQRDEFERTALKITGSAFYVPTAGLVIAAIVNIVNRQVPVTTFAGIIISAISIAGIYVLMRYKLYVGQKLDSEAIIADAHCIQKPASIFPLYCWHRVDFMPFGIFLTSMPSVHSVSPGLRLAKDKNHGKKPEAIR